MILSNAVTRNGLLLIVPALAFTFALWPQMPTAFGEKAFDEGIPSTLIAIENLLRVAVLAMPFFLRFGRSTPYRSQGWALYAVGLGLYLASYLVQIIAPTSAWSMSALGFTAPAWTTLFWLLGIGVVCADSWLPLQWNRVVYLTVVGAFVLVHTSHAYLAYLRHPA